MTNRGFLRGLLEYKRIGNHCVHDGYVNTSYYKLGDNFSPVKDFINLSGNLGKMGITTKENFLQHLMEGESDET